MNNPTNGGPAETVIDGVTGYLVPPEDPDALADRVLALLRDAALRVRMGEAGRAHVLSHFTATAYAARVAELIETYISKKFLHDFFLFNVADFTHDFRRFIHYFLNTLLFHVSCVNNVENFVFQLVVQVVAFFKIVFGGSGSTKNNAF